MGPKKRHIFLIASPLAFPYRILLITGSLAVIECLMDIPHRAASVREAFIDETYMLGIKIVILDLNMWHLT